MVCSTNVVADAASGNLTSLLIVSRDLDRFWDHATLTPTYRKPTSNIRVPPVPLLKARPSMCRRAASYHMATNPRRTCPRTSSDWLAPMPHHLIGSRQHPMSRFGGGHTSSPGARTCPRGVEEEGIISTPPPTITSINNWAHMLDAHTYEEFVSLVALYQDHTCMPCENASCVALICPSQIQHFVYGSWQCTLETQECVEGLYRILKIDPSIPQLQQPESDQIVCLGEAPTRWTRSRHFPLHGSINQPKIPI